MHNHTYIKKRAHRAMAMVLAIMLMLLCGCASTPQDMEQDDAIIVPDEPNTDITDPPVSDEPSDIPDSNPVITDTPDSTDAPDSTDTPDNTDAPDAPPPRVFPPHKEIDEPFLVVVDAGHGGSDPGAVISDVHEKNIDLAVALKIKTLLEENNIEVVMTRSTDKFVSLPDRHSLANQMEADLVISVHCNVYTADPDIDGLECYYRENAPKAVEFAQNILMATKAKAIPVRSSRVEDYQILVHTKMPAVLVEMGFMTCPEELQNLTDDAYQQILASAITEAILKTLNG